ncbi:Uncharacterised protein [Mycobacteroides abscessus subsp. abscessus]|nr:Uncharacterised protein [Mycobacteroides abscessus subsp. abscessus]
MAEHWCGSSPEISAHIMARVARTLQLPWHIRRFSRERN